MEELLTQSDITPYNVGDYVQYCTKDPKTNFLDSGDNSGFIEDSICYDKVGYKYLIDNNWISHEHILWQLPLNNRRKLR